MLDPQPYIGIAFKEKGRDKEGWDCWGLVRFVLNEQFGSDLPSNTEFYKSTSDLKEISDKIDLERAKWKLIEKPEPGDVAVLRMWGVGAHVALVVDSRHMLHVEKGVNTVLENFTRLMWQKRIIGFYRHESIG